MPRFKLISRAKPKTDADHRLARMSADGFADLGEAITAIQSAYPNARYITPYSVALYFASRKWKVEIHVIRPDGADAPAKTRQFTIITPVLQQQEFPKHNSEIEFSLN